MESALTQHTSLPPNEHDLHALSEVQLRQLYDEEEVERFMSLFSAVSSPSRWLHRCHKRLHSMSQKLDFPPAWLEQDLRNVIQCITQIPRQGDLQFLLIPLIIHSPRTLHM